MFYFFSVLFFENSMYLKNAKIDALYRIATAQIKPGLLPSAKIKSVQVSTNSIPIEKTSRNINAPIKNFFMFSPPLKNLERVLGLISESNVATEQLTVYNSTGFVSKTQGIRRVPTL